MKKLRELGINPAPWNVLRNGEIVSQEGFIFGIKKSDFGCRVVFTTEEDARLIAAAPELYEVLQQFVSYAESHAPLDPALNPVIDKARAALAKASRESEAKDDE